MVEQCSNGLAGRRALLLEDDYLVGMALRQQLETVGIEVKGPVATIEAARQEIRGGHIDCALLDINIRGESSETLAEDLHAAGTPFLFITGYQSPALLTDAMRSVKRLMKPVEIVLLREELDRMLAQRS